MRFFQLSICINIDWMHWRSFREKCLIWWSYHIGRVWWPVRRVKIKSLSRQEFNSKRLVFWKWEKCTFLHCPASHRIRPARRVVGTHLRAISSSNKSSRLSAKLELSFPLMSQHKISLFVVISIFPHCCAEMEWEAGTGRLHTASQLGRGSVGGRGIVRAVDIMCS